MADFGPTGVFWTRKAGADLRLKQYYLVKEDTDGRVVICGDGEKPLGVLWNTPNTNEPAQIAPLDGSSIWKVIANGNSVNIAVDDSLKCGADGIAAKTTTDNTWVIGLAREACAIDGQIIKFHAKPGARY